MHVQKVPLQDPVQVIERFRSASDTHSSYGQSFLTDPVYGLHVYSAFGSFVCVEAMLSVSITDALICGLQDTWEKTYPVVWRRP